MYNFTRQMEQWYVERTMRHIDLVREYCTKLANLRPEFEELFERMFRHDESKFNFPEKVPYIWITWKYKCLAEGWDFKKFNPPEDIEKDMVQATIQHVLTNSHHPEYHAPDIEGCINASSRDKPSGKLVDATAMPDLDLAEMCCDWCAVSREKGNSPIDWARENIGVRWKFSPKQEKLIYSILAEIWP